MEECMKDLEITKLCAEAMGYQTFSDQRDRELPKQGLMCLDTHYFLFDPLHDDAQAMALVKKMNLWISNPTGASWDCFGPSINDYGNGPDLNLAICECVAKMQLSRSRENAQETQS